MEDEGEDADDDGTDDDDKQKQQQKNRQKERKERHPVHFWVTDSKTWLDIISPERALRVGNAQKTSKRLIACMGYSHRHAENYCGRLMS